MEGGCLKSVLIEQQLKRDARPSVGVFFVSVGIHVHCADAKSADVVLSIAIDVCSALKHLHGCGIVHRDVAARNVLLSPVAVPSASGGASVAKWHAVLNDFGLARKLAVGNETSVSSVCYCVSIRDCMCVCSRVTIAWFP